MDQMGIHYNIWIVLLSYGLAAAAAYSALNLISQVSHSAGRVRRLWLLSGACVLGGGIWAMHFVGIMASRLPFKVSYHPVMAAVSLLIIMSSCYATLQMVTAARQRSWRLLRAAAYSAAAYRSCIMLEWPPWRWRPRFITGQWIRLYRY